MARQIHVDNLRSLLGGLGDPSRDKNAAVYYDFPFISDMQLVNAYRSSWLARKIVEGLGLEVATPDEAREILQLKGADRVAF